VEEALLCGEVHYFRVPRALWRDILLKLKMAGFNGVNTYFAWNYHEERPGVFDVSGEKDFNAFIETAGGLGLKVIARVGPYICSEWDNGGHPDWLISRGLVARSLDPSYFPYAERWLRFVLSQLARYSARRGGNVAVVQLENEYFWGDVPYHERLREIARQVGIDVDLYTNVNRYVRNTEFIDSVDLYPRPWDVNTVIAAFKDLESTQPGRRVKIMEYEGGWFSRIDRPLPTERGSFPPNWTKMLLALAFAYGADLVSMYMFHGGTNFAYWTGRWITTSYDYEAPVREWGELWDRYYKVKLVAPIAYLAAGSELVSEEASGGRVKVVRRRADGSRLIFYINSSDQPWVEEVRIQPRDVKVVAEGLKLGFITLVKTSANLLGVVGGNLILYDAPGEPFRLEIEGAEEYSCYGASAAWSGGRLVVEGVVPEEDVSGCLLRSRGEAYRVIVLPQKLAERTWISGDFFAVSNIYFVSGLSREELQAEVEDGRALAYVPLKLRGGEYIRELDLTKLQFTAAAVTPLIHLERVEVSEAGYEQIAECEFKPLEELGVFRHDYYVYSTELDEDADIYVRVNDHATIVNRGEVIASGFLSVSAKAGKGRLEVIVDSTGHPNDGIVPTFTGALSPILVGKTREEHLKVNGYGVVDLSHRFQPGLPTPHSHSYLVNREVAELAAKARWQEEVPELNMAAGVIYARMSFEGEKLPTVLRFETPGRLAWSPITVLVNGREVYRGYDREVYVDPDLLVSGVNEVVLGFPVYNVRGRPELEFKGSAAQYRGCVREGRLARLCEAGAARQASIPLELRRPSFIRVRFRVLKPGDTVAPLYLELEGRFNAQIYLNGVMIGRFYGDGSQKRFYMPEPYLAEDNELLLLAVPLCGDARIEKLGIAPYYVRRRVALRLE